VKAKERLNGIVANQHRYLQQHMMHMLGGTWLKDSGPNFQV
jgi:hypothetical protein